MLLRNTKEVFNSREAAEYLRIGYDIILRETRIGNIRSIENGSSYLFRKSYLEEWLEGIKAF